MLESTKDEFTDCYKLLENIVNCWEVGKDVSQTNAFIAEISSKDQSVVSITDCVSEDMLPTSGNETLLLLLGSKFPPVLHKSLPAIQWSLPVLQS